MFAVITPALISGAFAERMKFKGYLVFITLWTTIVYFPVAHWIWGPAAGSRLLAFSTSRVELPYISTRVSASLAAALFIGKRKGFGSEAFVPHNLPMTILGARSSGSVGSVFNAGSSLSFRCAGRPRPSSLHTSRLPPQCSAGCSSKHCRTVSLPRSARLRAVSPTGCRNSCVRIYRSDERHSHRARRRRHMLLRGQYENGNWATTTPSMSSAFTARRRSSGSIALGFLATTKINPAGANGLLFGDASLLVKQLIGIG